MSRPGYIRLPNDLSASGPAVELAEEFTLPALGLYVGCLGYCDRQRTDGEIPRRAMARVIAPGLEYQRSLAELVRVGFLETTADGWRVVDYLGWQRSREQIEGASESARQAARSRWSNAGRTAEGTADRTAEGNAPNQPSNHPSNQPPTPPSAAASDGGEVVEIIELSGQRLKRSQAERLLGEHGAPALTAAMRQIAADERGGLQVTGSYHGLLRHRLKNLVERRTPDGVPFAEL